MALTVTKLIEQLSALPGDLPVMVAADAEGNHFDPIYEVAQATGCGDDIEWYPVDWSDIGEDGHAYHPDEVDERVVIWPS